MRKLYWKNEVIGAISCLYWQVYSVDLKTLLDQMGGSIDISSEEGACAQD